MSTNPVAIETIPADIASEAMVGIMDGLGVEEAVFLAAIESTNACHDRDFAKAYGLKHWAKLSESSRGAWDWVFGRENRLPGWATRDLSKLNRIEDRIFARQEARYED